MSTPRPRWAYALSLIAAGALLALAHPSAAAPTLTAPKPGAVPPATAQPAAAPTAAPTLIAQAAAPKPGSTLNVAIQGDPQNLDPATTSGSPPAIEIIRNIYRGLVTNKIGTNDKGQAIALNEYAPDLAESWELAEGGKRVTFKLRKGMKFSNGDPIDAAAVKYTFDRAFDLKTSTASQLRMAKVAGSDAIKVIDDTTVEFTLDQANELLMANLVIYTTAILNPKVVKPNSTPADPLGREWLRANTKGTESGPYVLASVRPGTEYVLSRNPHFYGDPPKTERVVLRVVPEASTRLTLLRTGAVDAAKVIPLNDLVGLQSDPSVTVHRNPSIAVSFLGMNTKMPPFDNVKVRQAMAHAVPYDTIIKEALGGFGQPLTGPVPIGMPTKSNQVTVYKTDPARAKALLTEAGFPQGIKVDLYVRSELAESKAVGVWVKSEAAKAGIEVTVNEMQSAPFAAALTKKGLAFFHYPHWGSLVNDPFFHYFWHFTDSCCNYSNYLNPEVVNLINEHLVGSDPRAREAASKKIQEIVTRDAAWAPLYQIDDTHVTRRNVSGMVLYPDVHFRYYFMSKN